jgi:hypothetical protein
MQVKTVFRRADLGFRPGRSFFPALAFGVTHNFCQNHEKQIPRIFFHSLVCCGVIQP